LVTFTEVASLLKGMTVIGRIGIVREGIHHFSVTSLEGLG